MSNTAGERPVSIEVIEEPNQSVELKPSQITTMASRPRIFGNVSTAVSVLVQVITKGMNLRSIAYPPI